MKPYTALLKINLKQSILFLLFAFFIKLNSQIIYTDILDATPNASYSLDLNNDTIVDFAIIFGMSSKVMCFTQGKNAYLGNYQNSNYLARALSKSNSICDSLSTWYDSIKPGVMAWDTNIGYWVGAKDKYLALKLVKGSNTYFGWARFDVTENSGSFTLKDYAYESTPNKCIMAGKTNDLGVNENTNINIFSIYPNPFNSIAKIQFVDDLKSVELSLFNSLGQKIMHIENFTGNSISISREYLLNGVYYLHLNKGNEKIIVKKMIIIN